MTMHQPNDDDERRIGSFKMDGGEEIYFYDAQGSGKGKAWIQAEAGAVINPEEMR